MRLISCHIENFGKLKNFDHTFTLGVNVIHEENGWGKTTFAAFIKAMFYGLPSSAKRSVLENERKKYQPWQGGSYGGSLTFEEGNAAYRIERFFGDKDRDDVFTLYNVSTGLESHDYSAAIGEELFGINAEGYERSAYIPQLGLNITANDSINTKLSHLLDDGNDMNNYETALASLEGAMKIYKKTGNRGKLGELETRLAQVERELEKSDGIEDALPTWETRLCNQKEELRIMTAEQSELKRKVIDASQYEAQKAKQEHYRQLCDDKRRIEKTRQTLQEFFRGHEPTEEELRKTAMQQDSLGELGARIEAEEEKCSFYENACRENAKEAKDHSKGIVCMLGVIAIVFLITSVLFFVKWMSVVLGLSAATAGIAALVLLIVMLRRSSAVQEGIRKKSHELLDKHNLAMTNVARMKQARAAHEQEVTGMIQFYFHDMRPSELRECIEELKRRKQALKDADAEYDRICETVKSFEEQNHIAEQELPPAQSQAAAAYESLQELQKKESAAEQRIESIRKEISELERKTEKMGRTLEEHSELMCERDRIEEELRQNRERYEILEDTAKYLQKAKEVLSTHYFGDIRESFDEYIQMLCSSLSGSVNMDIRFGVKVDAAGARRELDYYSEGYKDMIGICTRFALIDVLFAGEKPFIILDDPFASLDEEKLDGMLQMLQEVGQKYQIVYFVCHKSRAV